MEASSLTPPVVSSTTTVGTITPPDIPSPVEQLSPSVADDVRAARAKYFSAAPAHKESEDGTAVEKVGKGEGSGGEGVEDDN
jgi:hypothetical protein